MGRQIHINFKINTNFLIVLGITIMLIGIILFIPNSQKNDFSVSTSEINENLNSIESSNNFEEIINFTSQKKLEENLPIEFGNELDEIIPYIDSDAIEFEKIVIDCTNYESPYESKGGELFLDNKTIDLDRYREELKQYVKNLNIEDEQKLNCFSNKLK